MKMKKVLIVVERVVESRGRGLRVMVDQEVRVGGPLVAVHVYGPTIEMSDHMVTFGGPSSAQEKGLGKAGLRYGYAQGGAEIRGGVAMKQTPKDDHSGSSWRL